MMKIAFEKIFYMSSMKINQKELKNKCIVSSLLFFSHKQQSKKANF